jgi:hypothetical protein
MMMMQGAMMGAGVVVVVCLLGTFPIGGVFVGNYLLGPFGALLGLGFGMTIAGAIVGAMAAYSHR